LKILLVAIKSTVYASWGRNSSDLPDVVVDGRKSNLFAGLSQVEQ
jgi:hypothetical protein